MLHQLAEDIDKLSLISEPYASYSYENTIQHHDASRSINRTHAGEHRLSKMDGNKLKRCFYCQMTKVRTRSGYRVKTTSHCVACEVPLCAGSTKCFQFYHELLKSSGHHVSSQGYHGWWVSSEFLCWKTDTRLWKSFIFIVDFFVSFAFRYRCITWWWWRIELFA